jgi:hypothetical protein
MRGLVHAGLVAALMIALAASLPAFNANRECRGGAFSSGFSAGFDIKRCDLVIRKNGGDVVLRIRLPQ